MARNITFAGGVQEVAEVRRVTVDFEERTLIAELELVDKSKHFAKIAIVAVNGEDFDTFWEGTPETSSNMFVAFEQTLWAFLESERIEQVTRGRAPTAVTPMPSNRAPGRP